MFQRGIGKVKVNAFYQQICGHERIMLTTVQNSRIISYAPNTGALLQNDVFCEVVDEAKFSNSFTSVRLLLSISLFGVKISVIAWIYCRPL